MPSNKEIIETLSRKIDNCRKERKLSYQKMADVCKMDKAQIYKICTKGIDIRVTSIVKIADGLGVKLTDILTF
jgi:transcriptional regulator with XRE-family HTH domain